MTTKIKRIILFSTILFIYCCSAFSLPPDWEIVDIRYDIPDPFKDNTYAEIKCADSANCFIWNEFNGAGGYYFRRTTDGGDSWKNMYMDSAYYRGGNDYKWVPEINEIAYPNEKLFIAVGDSGLIVRTTDKGESWDSFRLDSNVTLFKLRMLDENYGIMLSAEYPIESMDMLETTDGGKTWNKMSFLFDGNIFFEDIDLINRNQIAAIIWVKDTIPGHFKQKFLMVYNNWERCDTLAIPKYSFNLDFVNENQGWISGGYLSSQVGKETTQQIYYTDNGGKTWIEQRNDHYDYGSVISGISFFDDKFGIAKSSGALTLITTNGGNKWEEMILVNIDTTRGTIYPISSIDAASPTTAYAILLGDTVYKYTRVISDVREGEYEELCDVYIKHSPNEEELLINLECKLKGEVSFVLYDLLGNIVFAKEVNKNSYSLTVPIDQLVHSGIYFIKISIDDKFIYNDRIVIVK